MCLMTAGCAVGQKSPLGPRPVDAGQEAGLEAGPDAAPADASPEAGTSDAATPSCDPIAQDCPAAEACYVMDVDLASGELETTCEAAGKGVQGAGCGAHGDCARGYQCSEGLCAQFCEPAGDLDCPVGSRCENLGAGVGLCV